MQPDVLESSNDADGGVDDYAAHKRAVIAQALEGQRDVDEIADEAGVTGSTLRTWLHEHYSAHPDDPRHHLVSDGAQARANEGNDYAREDMGSKKKKRPRMASKRRQLGLPHPKRDEIIALAVANRALPPEKRRLQKDIAEEYGVAAETLSTWLSISGNKAPHTRGPRAETGRSTGVDAVRPEYREKYLAVVQDFKEGKDNDAIAAKHGLGVSTLQRWRRLYKLDTETMRTPKTETGAARPRDLVVNGRKRIVIPDDDNWPKFVGLMAAGQLNKNQIGNELGIGKSKLYRWVDIYEVVRLRESRMDRLAKARATRQELLKDPAYRAEEQARRAERKAARQAMRQANRDEIGQLSLPVSAASEATAQLNAERTMASSSAQRYSPTPPSAVVRSAPAVRYPEPPRSVRDEMLEDSFQEAVEERNSLRGMVKILQRERDEFERQLAKYRRRYGEIQ